MIYYACVALLVGVVYGLWPLISLLMQRWKYWHLIQNLPPSPGRLGRAHRLMDRWVRRYRPTWFYQQWAYIMPDPKWYYVRLVALHLMWPMYLDTMQDIFAREIYRRHGLPFPWRKPRA